MSKMLLKAINSCTLMATKKTFDFVLVIGITETPPLLAYIR
jgi:hypothetical protein